MINFLKNLFKYRLYFSRAWFLLFIIWFFLTIISFIKWIQILIFIPAFVLSIFLYSLFEILFIKKNLKLNFNIWKNWNILKLFSNNNKKYNYILANKDINWNIDFLHPNNELIYLIDTKKKYNLYLYVFWKFDIFRKIIHIWNFDFFKDLENESYTISKKYEEWDFIDKIDILKTSIKQIPYLKKQENINVENKDFLKLIIQSNNVLELKWKENIFLLHIFLIIIWSIWLIIEWQDVVLTATLIWSIIICIFLQRKRIKLNNKKEKIIMIFLFICMLFLSLLKWDMSGSWSVFLIQLLLIMTLNKKWSKNSFLFIFLTLFVFVAISLFSNQIRFILLFLLYLFIATYLLFFISWDETYNKLNYKIWNISNKYNLLKTFFIIVFLIFIFYFLLPHWNSSNSKTWLNNDINNKKEIISWFNEEIELENISKISTDTNKIFVIEDLEEYKIEKLKLKYFRWMRYENFDWKKWHSKYKNINTPFSFNKNYTWDNKINLKFNYYLNWTKNIFIPKTVINIEKNNQNYNNIMYFNLVNDNTILKIWEKNIENLILNLTFSLDEKWKIIDEIDKINNYDFSINDNTKEIFKDFLLKIPPDITNSSEKLTNYIKYKAWFTYSTENISSDINDFLYWKKSWHCEYFATTLAVVLQYYWFEATLVNWFINWEYNDLAKSLIIRWKNAHSWVEIYDEKNKIWKIYDSTPNEYWFLINNYELYLKPLVNFYDYIDIKWYTYIVNYTSEEQKKLIQYLFLNKFNLLKFFIVLILIIFVFKILFYIYNFLILSKKEKIMFIISIFLKNKHFALNNISNKKLEKKYNDFIYWNKKEIGYIEFFKDMLSFH